MPEFISNVQTQNAYVDALTLGPADNIALLNFSVLGQPALATFWHPVPGQIGKHVLEQFERRFIANTIAAYAQNVSGVKFRSAVAGMPATINAEIAFLNDPKVFSGTVSAVAINQSGQTGGDVVSGHVSSTGAILSGTGFTVVHSGVGQYDLTFTSPFPAAPVVFVELVGVTLGDTTSLQNLTGSTATILVSADRELVFTAFVPS